MAELGQTVYLMSQIGYAFVWDVGGEVSRTRRGAAQLNWRRSYRLWNNIGDAVPKEVLRLMV